MSSWCNSGAVSLVWAAEVTLLSWINSIWLGHVEGWRWNLKNEELWNVHALFDVEGYFALIVQNDRDLFGVIVIYGPGGDHDPMVGNHATPTGYKTKGALS